MTDNPYAAPGATVDTNAAKHAQGGKLYSPTQAALGAFLGGPVGLIYFLKANFTTLGNERLEKKTLALGIVFTLALIALLPFLPEKFPSAPISIVYIVIARIVAEKYQMTKQAIIDSPDYAFHSNWRVLWIGLLCLAISFVLIVSAALLMELLGILPE